MAIEIYTDGATSANGHEGARGGWAYIVLDGGMKIASAAEHVEPATNNICELLAILSACKYIIPTLKEFDSVTIYSDSAYIINCVHQRWYRKWQSNGWITSQNKFVKNRPLWKELIPFFEDPRFKWVKVKAHNGNFWNEEVDKMAVKAKEKNESNSN